MINNVKKSSHNLKTTIQQLENNLRTNKKFVIFKKIKQLKKSKQSENNF